MSKGIFKAGLLLFLISIISKLMGFFREVLIANHYGTSSEADAYYIALTPGTLAITFSIAISSVFLPLFIKLSLKRKEAFLFGNNVLTMFLLGVVMLYLLFFVFTDLFINLLAPGLSVSGKALSIDLLKIMLPLVFIVIAIQIYILMLNSFDEYLYSAASVIPNNLIIILYLLIFGDRYGIEGVAYVTLFAFSLQLIVLYLLIKYRFQYTLSNLKIWGNHSKSFIILLFPILISSALSQLNAVVDRMLASSISEGAVASLSYAFRLRGIATGIFITPIITLTFPKLSRSSHKNDRNEVVNLTQNSIYTVFFLLLPLTIIFMVYSEDIIQFLFERGSFDHKATKMTSAIFWGYSLGILAIGFRDVTLRTFYSYGDTKTPAIVLILSSIVNVILSYLLVKPFGLAGLGFSSSVSFIITSLIIIVLLRSKMDGIWSKEFNFKMLKMFSAAGLSSMIILYFKERIQFSLPASEAFNQFILLGLVSIITYLLFIVILLLFKEKQLYNLHNDIQNKLKGRIKR
jgi:putative peptidoglycan lipid II flippase